MLRATRALAAMLTSGALACTFDHSGLLAGPLPDDETSGLIDASASDGGGLGESPGDDVGDANSGPDDFSDEEMTATDAVVVDPNDGGDAGTEDSPSPPDSSFDVPPLDEASDAALPDGAFDCTSVPNGAA